MVAKTHFTPGKTNWLTEISKAAGAVNIFQDVELASVQTDWQDIITRQPDFLCIAWVGVRKSKVQRSAIMKRPDFKKLNISDEQIFILEEELYCRPSPRLLEGLEKLDKLLRQKTAP